MSDFAKDTDVLISRQAVLKELPHALWGKEWDEALAKAIIESVPTIDPVKHGKWETKQFYGKDFEEVPNHVWCICPFCKNKLGVFEKDNYFQFCPLCGARLDG